MDIYLDPTGPITAREPDGHTTLFPPGRWIEGSWVATKSDDLPLPVREVAIEHWDSGRVAAYRDATEPVPPTPEEQNAAINAERQRRIIAGKVINGIFVTGRDEDARNLTNLALAAQMRIGMGDTTTLTTYRDGANVDHDLTPPEMLALWQQSAEYVSALYAASWAIKAMDPLPEDITDDAIWT